MPFIPYTDEEKQIANNVDLEYFLRMRGEKIERAGHEHKLVYADNTGKHDSITIDGSTWYDHKNRVGGGAIKFMRYFYGMDFQTAMNELLGKCSVQISRDIPKTAVPEKKPKTFVLPEENANMHRVYAYLIKQRYISPDVITFFAKKHLIYEDKAHHNAVFVGVDEKGVPKQAHLRSTNSFGNTFRITCEGSDTKYSFSHLGQTNKIYVFEAPIDMLSYITMHPDNWQQHSYIAMNGVYENAVITALELHSGLTEIVLCTDNDEGGIDAAERLNDILKEKGYENISRELPVFKDWNECLKAENGAEPLAAVPHKRKQMYAQAVSELQYFRCDPSRIIDRISKTFRSGQYKYLAEYSLAASAFFICRKEENMMFDKLKQKLSDEYRTYTDKGRLTAKQDELKTAYQSVMKDLRHKQARTREEIIQTSKQLFQLADCAMRCETEQEMCTPEEEPVEEVQQEAGIQLGGV